MQKSRGVERAGPTFSLSSGAEGVLADGVLIGVDEPKRDAQVTGDLTPIVLEAVELVSHTQWGARQVGSRAKAEGDIPGRGRHAQLFAGVQGNGLAVNAEGADFEKLIGLAAQQTLDSETPTQPAEEAAEAQTLCGTRCSFSWPSRARAGGKRILP